MPDASLFKQEFAGIKFWNGIFEREPVTLLCHVESLAMTHKLYKINQFGDLILICTFIGVKGTCQLTGREMNLLMHGSSAYISTVDKPKPKPPIPKWSDIPKPDKAWRVDAEFFKQYFGQQEPSYYESQSPWPKQSAKAAVPTDCFSVLGVSQAPTENEIRDAFRKKIKENHPDQNPNDIEGASKRSRDLYTARDEAKRKMGYK